MPKLARYLIDSKNAIYVGPIWLRRYCHTHSAIDDYKQLPMMTQHRKLSGEADAEIAD